MPVEPPSVLARDLLGWYDRHARDLPWRTPPGVNVPPDPYAVWLSEIMLQQTTVATVRERFAAFIARWPDIAALAVANDADVLAQWAGLGYYARARNLIACARAVVRDHGGAFPRDEATLRQLPGIGDYTAAAISAFAFGQRAVVVDGNIERVISRIDAIDTPLPSARPLIRAAMDRYTPSARAGDFAQAMMDLAATICTPRTPQCLICPIASQCGARRGGDPAMFPVKAPRKAKPLRTGTVYWIERDNAIWLVQRPARGLLGGMRALPGSEWITADAAAPATDAKARTADAADAADVRHVFTHFELHLAIVQPDAATAANIMADQSGAFWPLDRIDAAGLPTLYRKVVDRHRGGATPGTNKRGRPPA